MAEGTSPGGRRHDRLPRRRVLARRVAPVALVLCGVALVAAGVTGSSPPRDFGAIPAAVDEAAVTPATHRDADAVGSPDARGHGDAVRSSGAAQVPDAHTGSAEVGTRSARLADREAAAPDPEPTGLSLPRLGIDAPVTPVGVVPATGEMEVPDDVGVAGWYRYGAPPGAAEGSAVLAAHVDDRRQGLGAFAALRDAREGDDVAVTRADGTVVRFTVSARQQVAKADLPTALFERTGPHRLVLITCGGDFDAASRSYRDNVIVVAEPSGEPVP